jgi:hypothetical protein
VKQNTHEDGEPMLHAGLSPEAPEKKKGKNKMSMGLISSCSILKQFKIAILKMYF